MSTQNLTDVVAQSMKDPAFADRFRADPEGVLGNHDLTETELNALKAGDQQKLDEIIDQRAGGIVIAGIVTPSSEN